MTIERVWLFPVAVFIWVPATFIITYAIGVHDRDVQAFFPYISDTGALPPESCVFGQLLNMGAVLMGICIYLRHRQIMEYHRWARHSRRWFLRGSMVCLWIGFSAAFGATLVANFQETSNIIGHMIGAFMAFGLGLVYAWTQVIYTYKMKPIGAGMWLAHVRFLLTLLASIFFFAMFGVGFYKNYDDDAGVTTTTQLNATDVTSPTGVSSSTSTVMSSTTRRRLPMFVYPGNPGYAEHLTSTICEWLMSFCFMAYFLTYAAELRYATLVPPKLVLRLSQEDLPNDGHSSYSAKTDGGSEGGMRAVAYPRLE